MESIRDRFVVTLRSLVATTSLQQGHTDCPLGHLQHRRTRLFHQCLLLNLPDELLCSNSGEAAAIAPVGIAGFVGHNSLLALSATNWTMRRFLLENGWPRFDDTSVSRKRQAPMPKSVLRQQPFPVKGLRVTAPTVEALEQVLSFAAGVGKPVKCGSGSGLTGSSEAEEGRAVVGRVHLFQLPNPASLQSLTGTFGHTWAAATARTPTTTADSVAQSSSGGTYHHNGTPFPLRALAETLGLTGLVRLEVRFGNIAGWALSDVAQTLPLLQDLCLSGIGITDNLRSLSSMRGLKRLELFCCHRVEGDLASLATLKSLVSLKISNCSTENITGDLSSLSLLGSLQALSLNVCNAVTGNLSSLCSLQALSSLTLYDCNGVHGDLASVGSSLKDLQELELGCCRGLVGDVASLRSLFMLKELELFSCSEIRGCLSSLAAFSSLESLTLRSCGRVGGDLSVLAALFGLKSLTLWRCDQVTVANCHLVLNIQFVCDI
jgi:hypothetical protein